MSTLEGAPDAPRQGGRPGDLGRRVAVAGVGVPAIVGLLYAGGWMLGVPLALLAAIGALETYRLGGARGVRPFRAPGALVAGAVVLVAVARPGFAAAAPWILALVGSLTVATLVAALFLRGPAGAPLEAVAVTLVGALYAGLPVAFVPWLLALPAGLGWGEGSSSPWLGPITVALPLATTWIGDAAAYFAGSAWGRAKLFPSVSPGKSWIGAWAGVGAAAAVGLVWHAVATRVLPGLDLSAVGAVAVGAALGVAAIFGDLTESLLKREAGVKDSGSLFPGHGGALDRLDALTATLPLSYVLLLAAERLG